MKFILSLLIALSLINPSALYAFGSIDIINSEKTELKKDLPVKPGKKKQKKPFPRQDRTPNYLLKGAVFISILCVLFPGLLLFMPVFIFGIAFYIAFLWFIGGLMVTLSYIMILVNFKNYFREQKEDLAANIIAFMLTRILLILVLFLAVDFFIGLIFAISFIPALIVQILMISMLLSKNKNPENSFNPNQNHIKD